MKNTRPLRPAEHQALDAQLTQLDRNARKYTWLLLAGISLASGVAIFDYFRMNTRGQVIVLALTLAVYVGIGLWIFRAQKARAGKKRKNIAFVKDGNVLTSIEVNGGKYYELAEEEDEGTFYLFQLDAEHVLSFGGQDFRPDAQFPSDKFEIVEGRGPDDEIVLFELYVEGQKAAPARVFSGQAKWDIMSRPDYPAPDKFTVVKGKIEDFVPHLTPRSEQ